MRKRNSPVNLKWFSKKMVRPSELAATHQGEQGFVQCSECSSSKATRDQERAELQALTSFIEELRAENLSLSQEILRLKEAVDDPSKKTEGRGS